jgi:acetyl esterase
MNFLHLFGFFGLMWICYFFVNEYSEHEKDMDWPSYLFAKTAKWYLPNPFPHNNTRAISLLRTTYDLSLTYPSNFEISRNPDLAAIVSTDVRIPVEGGSIPIRIYNVNTDDNARSTSSTNDLLKPVMVWYHGGGMIIGSMEGSHGHCVKFANHTNFIIVNVDYRLAPEHIFPTPLNDAYAAFLWVEKHISEYGGNPKELFVGGDSAGGYLATTITARYISDHLERIKSDGVCMEHHPHDDDDNESKKLKRNSDYQSCAAIHILPKINIIGLVDVYPGLNATSHETEEAKLYGKSSGLLPLEEPEWMRSLYQGSATPDWTIRNNWWFSPFFTPEEILSYFPQTILILAKYDVLSHEGLEFKKRLDRVKVPVELSVYNSTVHAFFGHPLIPVGNVALKEAADWMKKTVEKTRRGNPTAGVV